MVILLLSAQFLSACTGSINKPLKIDNDINRGKAVEAPSAASVAQAFRAINGILVAPVYSDVMAKDLVITEGQAQQIEDHFTDAFRSSSKLEVFSLKTLPKVPYTQGANQVSSVSRLSDSKLLSLARDNGISSVLFIKVSKLQERSGSAFGSNELASLSLTAQIYNVQGISGQDLPVWRSGYDYSDKAKPLISFEDGKLASLRFKSVSELSQEAALQIAEEFAAARQKSFAK